MTYAELRAYARRVSAECAMWRWGGADEAAIDALVQYLSIHGEEHPDTQEVPEKLLDYYLVRPSAGSL